MQAEEKILYRPKEVAQMLSVCQATVYSLIKYGKLECVMFGHSPRISREQIDAYIRTNTKKGTQ